MKALLANILSVVEAPKGCGYLPGSYLIEARSISRDGDATLFSNTAYTIENARKKVLAYYFSGNVINEEDFTCATSRDLNWEQGEVLAAVELMEAFRATGLSDDAYSEWKGARESEAAMERGYSNHCGSHD